MDNFGNDILVRAVVIRQDLGKTPIVNVPLNNSLQILPEK